MNRYSSLMPSGGKGSRPYNKEVRGRQEVKATQVDLGQFENVLQIALPPLYPYYTRIMPARYVSVLKILSIIAKNLVESKDTGGNSRCRRVR